MTQLNKTDVYVGLRIRLRRLQLQMTQAELAFTAQICSIKLDQIEAGEVRPDADALYSISQALHVPSHRFFEDTFIPASLPSHAASMSAQRQGTI